MLMAIEPDPEGTGIARLLAQAVLHAPGSRCARHQRDPARIVARGLAVR